MGINIIKVIRSSQLCYSDLLHVYFGAVVGYLTVFDFAACTDLKPDRSVKIYFSNS